MCLHLESVGHHDTTAIAFPRFWLAFRSRVWLCFAGKELRETREGRETLRSELEALRRRVEEEGTADAAGALRAQVSLHGGSPS